MSSSLIAQATAPDIPQLVDLAKTGDTAAFGLVYDHYYKMVFRYIYPQVYRDRHLAEDLASDTFLRAFKGIGGFAWQGRDFGAWLTTIARNLIISHHQTIQRRPEILTNEVPDSAVCQASNPEVIFENQVASDLAAAATVTLRDTVLQLVPAERRCIELRFFRGLSLDDTARIMGKKLCTLKALQTRAKRSLRRLLPEEISW